MKQSGWSDRMEEECPLPTETNVLSLIMDSGIVAKIVIFILLVFSTVSWATIAERWRYFRRAQDQSRRFLKLFHTQNDFEEIHASTAQWPDSPVANVFRTVYEKHRGAFSSQDEPAESPGMHQNMVESVYRELDRASHVELAKFEQRLPLLATAGSVCPFLGLFGTVWGVMTAFLDISTKGSTNIVVVAPGIAEALITTIAGLAVAIPAMVAYNYFVQRSRGHGLDLEDMSTTVLNILQLRGRPS